MSNKQLAVGEFFDKTRERLQLTSHTDQVGFGKPITNTEIHRPGLALAGFTERFANSRIQVLGETELTYLAGLAPEALQQSLYHTLSFDLPCLILSKGIPPLPVLVEMAKTHQTAVFGSSLTTVDLVNRLRSFLDHFFAPQTNVHGALVDVYDIGLLFTGRSGIGKSETALDLIERGHRLVADDVVTITRPGQDILIGTGNPILQHHMEVRGIGIIDIQSMFGIRAIRLRKRIEVEVRLVEWGDRTDYERTGIEGETTTILGVEVPFVTIPIFPGKNITVIAEVVALNHLLKIYGYETAQEFNQRLITFMQQKRAKATVYLRDDFE